MESTCEGVEMGYPEAKCPRCGQLCEATGRVSISDGPGLPVYECSAAGCTTPFEFEGLKGDAPLTWYVDADGRPQIIPIESP